jgi:hypothetical protein
MQHSTWDYEIVYADRSSKDKQLLVRPLLWKTKNTNIAGSWKLKFTFYFALATRTVALLGKWCFVQWKIMDIRTSFILITLFFDEVPKYGGGSKFWGYDGINNEPLCIELCIFVQCHFINHFIMLLLNVIQLLSIGMIAAYFWSLNFISWLFLIKGVLNIRNTNMVAEKYPRLYNNLLIFRIYNMG